MFSEVLLQKVVQKLDSAATGVPVVEGIRSDELPAPCVLVHMDTADIFHPMLTDVFNLNITCRYEAHYADSKSSDVKENFGRLLSAFESDDLRGDLDGAGYTVFKANVGTINSDIQNDFFVNEFTLDLVIERSG